MPETQTLTVTITLHYADEPLTPALVKDALGYRLPTLFPGEIVVDDTPSVELVPLALAMPVDVPLAMPVNDVLPGPFPLPTGPIITPDGISEAA